MSPDIVRSNDHLQQVGLLERRQHSTDRRTRQLYLTERGGQVLGEAARLGAGWERKICAGLSGEERDHLLALLRRVAANIGVGRDTLPDQGTGQRPEPLPAATATPAEGQTSA